MVTGKYYSQSKLITLLRRRETPEVQYLDEDSQALVSQWLTLSSKISAMLFCRRDVRRTRRLLTSCFWSTGECELYTNSCVITPFFTHKRYSLHAPSLCCTGQWCLLCCYEGLSAAADKLKGGAGDAIGAFFPSEIALFKMDSVILCFNSWFLHHTMQSTPAQYGAPL